MSVGHIGVSQSTSLTDNLGPSAQPHPGLLLVLAIVLALLLMASSSTLADEHPLGFLEEYGSTELREFRAAITHQVREWVRRAGRSWSWAISPEHR